MKEFTLTTSTPTTNWIENKGQIRTVLIDTTNTVWSGGLVQIEVSSNKTDVFGQEPELQFSSSQDAPRNFVYGAGFFRAKLTGGDGTTSVKLTVL